MVKHVLFLFACAAACKPAAAQYYYKDLVSNKQAAAERLALKEQKIRTIDVHSFEGSGETSEGFFCQKKISKDFRRVETFTRSYVTDKALLIAYYNGKDQLIKTTDSSELAVSTSTYTYNDKGNITGIVVNSHSSDDDFKTGLVEEHQYTYNEQQKPLRMLRIKNTKDTAVIDFVIDEKGNVTDEVEAGKTDMHYYYYYDAKNRLTDIVKYSPLKNRPVPDFVFEYNSANQVTQMTTVEEGRSGDYYTWKYTYNEGLRIIEKCFSKEKILLGYFEYEYN